MRIHDAFDRTLLALRGEVPALREASRRAAAAATALRGEIAARAPALRAGATTLWRRLRAEPLAHFLAIGLALLALDRIASPAEENPRAIRVDAAVHGVLVDIFAEARGRAPTAEEMAPLVDRWIMNETLYREALALGLDRGDEMIRERVMQKMRVLIQSGVEVSPPDEATLRAWFERNRGRYVSPAMLSIRLARVDGTEAEARAAAALLNDAEASGDAETAGFPVYPYAKRPRPAMAQVFGASFVAAVETLETGVWTAIETPGGWQAAILDAFDPAREPDFEQAANAAAADWTEETFRRTARGALDALIAGYEIARAPYDPAAFAERAETAAQALSADDTMRRGLGR